MKDEQGKDLLDIFDNFYALPYGPVESDIYNCITLDRLQYFSFKNFSLEKKQDYCDETLNDDMKQRIKYAIKMLRTNNQKIIKYNAACESESYMVVMAERYTNSSRIGKGEL